MGHTIHSAPERGQGRYVSVKTIAVGCPYHQIYLQGTVNKAEGNKPELLPMERFLREDASQQYAMFIRPDNEELSTARSCNCKNLNGDLVISDGERD
jgi:hypothetical protein